MIGSLDVRRLLGEPELSKGQRYRREGKVVSAKFLPPNLTAGDRELDATSLVASVLERLPLDAAGELGEKFAVEEFFGRDDVLSRSRRRRARADNG